MIELKDVSFSYPEQNEGNVQEINLTIPTGECIVLCGESGCGKTTITRLINGIIPHFYPGKLAGSVTIDGKSVSETVMYQLASKVGSVFQNPRTQFFSTDTDSEIAFGIENEALPPAELAQRVDQTTEDLKIAGLRGRNIFELSGGEKQKIAFASIYAMNPDIYLLDEPSSNLDLKSINELKQHLQLIKKQGKTIIIAEHRLYYLMELADRVVYLKNGRVAQIFSNSEFQSLPDETRKKLGLRAIRLDEETLTEPLASKQSPVLELRNLSIFHKKKPILDSLNLTANHGEIIGIVGQNGVGKTTFSRALCGLHKECRGEFLWQDSKRSIKQRLQLSYMVMQDVNYELFAESVESECSFGIKHPDQDVVEQTMSALNLLQFRHRHPNTLSGGQKQRVAVAVSKVGNKQLLLFDEPTSGLDYYSMTNVAVLIRHLAEAGNLIFVVTHDYEFIMRTCTRIIHLGKGKLLNDFPLNKESLPKFKEFFFA